MQHATLEAPERSASNTGTWLVFGALFTNLRSSTLVGTLSAGESRTSIEALSKLGGLERLPATVQGEIIDAMATHSPLPSF